MNYLLFATKIHSKSHRIILDSVYFYYILFVYPIFIDTETWCKQWMKKIMDDDFQSLRGPSQSNFAKQICIPVVNENNFCVFFFLFCFICFMREIHLLSSKTDILPSLVGAMKYRKKLWKKKFEWCSLA